MLATSAPTEKGSTQKITKRATRNSQFGGLIVVVLELLVTVTVAGVEVGVVGLGWLDAVGVVGALD